MKVSIITPSFNQAQFLPDNIETVSGQQDIELEHIIVDPGSSDGSLEIAMGASHALLINEPDRGQSHAICKGYARSTGEILAWLNSDDLYPNPHVLATVVSAFKNNPRADIVYGNVDFVGEKREFLRKGYVNKKSESLLESFQYQVGIVQPGVFMRRRVYEEVGGPSENFEYCMDYEYWVRKASAGFNWLYIDHVLAHHRWWSGMKTSSGRGDSLIEHFNVCNAYFGYIHYKWLDRYAEYMATGSDGVVNHAGTINQDLKDVCVRRAIGRFVTQDIIRNLEQASNQEMKDTLEYIKSAKEQDDIKRFFYNSNEISDLVSSHPDPKASQREAWHIFNSESNEKGSFKSYSVPNNFSRSFDSNWYYHQMERSREKILSIAARKKDCCIIVANGPSLNKSDPNLFACADVIISNYATISKQIYKHATYLTIVNDLVASQGSVHFNSLDIIKFVPFWIANSINPTESTFFLPATVEPFFCDNLSKNFSWRSTVSFLNMQLAFVLGYQKVILVGFDHSYSQPSDVKEGDSINQQKEDPNHFDPRYFMGKTWQAADTSNMEKMYLLAREAYDKAGRTIVNATVGGKLEVFEREDLVSALGIQSNTIPNGAKSNRKVKSVEIRKHHMPKILILDATPMGDISATGQVKATVFADYPPSKLLQIALVGNKFLTVVRSQDAHFQNEDVSEDDIEQVIDKFKPDLLLFRPIPDAERLHRFAMKLIKGQKLPFAIWIMDDWPTRMQICDSSAWTKMQPDLAYLIGNSAVRFSICDAMSREYKARYGVDFIPFANAVSQIDWTNVTTLSQTDRKFRIRFAGGLAPDMNRSSIIAIADAVEKIGHTHTSRFEEILFQIHTQPWWFNQVNDLFSGYRYTHLYASQLSSARAYQRWISEADLLVIAYNFDDTSLGYVRYSMANKLPECLATGVATLAFGPKGIATIDYLLESNVASCVTENNPASLESELIRLITDENYRQQLGACGRKFAFDRHSVKDVQKRFYACLRNAYVQGCKTNQVKLARHHTVEYLYSLANSVNAGSSSDVTQINKFVKACQMLMILNPKSSIDLFLEDDANLRGALLKASVALSAENALKNSSANSV